MRMKFAVLYFLITWLISCESDVIETSISPGKKSCGLEENSRVLNAITKILFIGNSHTYVGAIPETIGSMAKSAGDSTFIHKEIPGGYTFKEHSNRKETLQAIQEQKWDFVILQASGWKQAFKPSVADTAVFPYAEILINEIRENNADSKIIMYMTHGYENGVLTFNAEEWCEQDPLVCNYAGMQERVKNNYLEMSKRFKVEIAPAGMLWNMFIDENANIDLFRFDGVHATNEGSYLSACTIYSTIFTKSPVDKYIPPGISSEVSATIQNKVSEVLFHCNPNWEKY